jgi:hypothetical protein
VARAIVELNVFLMPGFNARAMPSGFLRQDTLVSLGRWIMCGERNQK